MAHVNAEGLIPQMWEADVLRTLQANLVADKICRKPMTKGKGKGDTVWFPTLGDPTIRDYTGTITTENIVSGNVGLLLDKDKYYSINIEDMEKFLSNVDIQSEQASRGGFMLQEAMDKAVLALYAEAVAANVATDATLDSATVLSAISECALKLEENNVKQGNMWMVVPPWVKQKLILAGVKFQINDGINGKGGIEFTKELDIDLYVTTNVHRQAATPQHYCLFGSYDAIGMEYVPMQTRIFQNPDAFGTRVEGHIAFGCKVLKPLEFGYADLTKAAETAI